MQPDSPAFASLGALLIITVKKSAREFVLGQMGTPMGEGNCSSFSPAWAAVCGAGWELKPGFRMGGKPGFFLWSLPAEPQASKQNLPGRTGGFRCFPLSDAVRTDRTDRQPQCNQSLPTAASFCLYFILVLKSLIVSMHFRYVAHTGSLNCIIRCAELRNLLLDYSGGLLICIIPHKC